MGTSLGYSHGKNICGMSVSLKIDGGCSIPGAGVTGVGSIGAGVGWGLVVGALLGRAVRVWS